MVRFTCVPNGNFAGWYGHKDAISQDKDCGPVLWPIVEKLYGLDPESL